MKKIFLLIALLAFGLAVGQNRPIRTDLIQVDTLTTTQRNTIASDAAKMQIIYNSTTQQLEQRKPGGSWERLGGSTAFENITGDPLGNAALGAVLDGKQATLVSGTNIKTVDGVTLLGSGDIPISAGGIVAEGIQTGSSTATHGLGYVPSESRIIITPLGTNSSSVDFFLSDITSTTLTVNNLPTGSGFAWAILGAGTETPLDGGEVVTLIDTELGDTDWRTNELATGAVTTDKILDGTIVNADVNASAAIAGTKIAYDPTASGLVATTAQAGIDEVVTNLGNLSDGLDAVSVDVGLLETRADSIVTALATPTTSAFSFTTYSTSTSAVLADAADGKIIFLDMADEEYTIPSGVFASGNSIRIQSIGSGEARILPGVGVDFGTWDGFQLPLESATDTIVNAITIARISSATGPEVWKPLSGRIKNYSVDPNIGNLFTTPFYGNLFSPSSSTAPTGLNNISGTISLETTTVFSGTSAMTFTGATTLQSSYFDIPTTGLATSDVLTLNGKVRIVNPGTQIQLRMYDEIAGFTNYTITGSTGVWLDFTFNHTLGGITKTRVYLRGDGTFIVDDLKLTKAP